MSGWDQDYGDMEVPGHITFANGRAGSFQFGLLQAQMDYSVRTGAKPRRIDFTWHGFDEGDELTGRGYAEIVDGKLNGHLYIHLGDDSAFRAVRQAVAARKSKSKRKSKRT
jgi:hypothetical protein